MGTYQDNRKYTNCIKEKIIPGNYTEYEQFDDYGNMIYLYKQIRPGPNEPLKVNVYNPQGSIVGTIIREIIGCQDLSSSLYDENNQLVKYIENTINCIYFLINIKIFESRVTLSGGCFQTYLEEFDQYDTRISYAIFNQCGDKFYFVYDEQNRLIYKITNHFFCPIT